MRKSLHATACGLLSCCLIGLPLQAQAAVIGTQAFTAGTPAQVEDARSRVMASIDRSEVRDQLLALGVTPDAVEQRLSNLSDAEITQLDQQLADLPAGAGVVELVGVVFIVLIILELVGITNIFNRF